MKELFMKKKYIYTLLLCFILNGEAITEETKKEEITTNNIEVTFKQFLQSFSNLEKTSGETECRKDEMLFCQSERRISDGRSGRNKTADNVICQCGPIQILSW